MIELNTRIQGLQSWQVRVSRVIDAIRDPTPGYRESIRNLERHVKLTFATKGAHSGKRWRRLRPRTRKARRMAWGYYRRAGGGDEANVWTGQMYRDYVAHGPKHIERIWRGGFEWGADYPSGFGSGRKWYRRTVLRFGRRGQRTAVAVGPIYDHIRRSIHSPI